PGMTLSVAGDDGASDDLGKKFPGLAAVLSDIPEKYNNHGVDYASLAEAFREAPLVAELRTKKIEDVEEYMGSFFEKIFKEKGEVETKLEENGIRGKKIQEIKIDVAVDVSSNFNIEEKTIDGSSVERSEENTYRFQVVFRQIIKGDGGEALSVKVQFPHGEEMVMITDVHLSTVTIPKEGVTALMQNFAANVLEDKGVPDDIQKIIAENVVTFSKMKEKSGLIFSKAAVFDNGLGLFLSKLARAGIQIGVVAPELWQRDAIAALNEEEKVNIVCLDNVGDAFDKMQASSYYYFKTEDDPDWSETRGIIQCDITGKIAIIIGALAAANHVTDVDVIKYMEQLADRFRQAV
ncbi:MAG: hypothetical protein ISS33_06885, partial [Candidatus Omnitrophica bacterium]|nr:hypothetical protein [Candidatus Omnitrophota bacterium]